MAEFTLQFLQVHSRAGVLNGIENVYAAVENRLEQAASRSVSVVKNSQIVGMNEIAPALEPRLQMPFP